MSRNLIILLIVSLFVPGSSNAGDDDLFPSVSGWKFVPGESEYTPDNLWDLIDGAAELYLSYGFEHLTLGEYTDQSGTDVRVEVYRHSSRTNAFGMYSQERNPEYHFINVGVQGYIEDGVLNFLSGPFYVKITTHIPAKQGRDAMTLIAGKVAESLHQDPAWPAPLTLLPTDARRPNSETYIAENFLGYSFLHSAFVADYGKAGTIQAFVIELSTEEQAQRMASAYLKETQSGSAAQEGSFKIQDPNIGPVYLLVQGRFFCGVVRCGEEKTAESLLKEMQGRVK